MVPVIDGLGIPNEGLVRLKIPEMPAYAWLARREDTDMHTLYGAEYEKYCAETPRSIILRRDPFVD